VKQTTERPRRIRRVTALFCALLLLLASFSGCEEFNLKDLALDYVQVTVSYEVISESENNVPLLTCELTATVANNYIVDLINATTTLSLASGMELTQGKKENKDASIPTGTSVAYAWTVKIPVTTEDRNLEYSVSVTSEVSSAVSAYDLIFVKGVNENDNRLDFSKDTWSFSNFAATPIPLAQDDYNALMLHLSATERTLIRDNIAGGNNGHCYGMAITTILAKIDRLSIDRLQAGSASLHDVKKNENAKSAIGYYYVTQFLSPAKDLIASYTVKDEKSKIEDLQALATDVSQGGLPVLLAFWMSDGGGHAVVAYGCEPCHYTYGGTTYESCILIYDNNFPKWTEDAYLYFDDNGNWVIPKYETANSIGMVTTDMKYVDFFNLESSRKSAYSYITARGNTDLQIESGGKTLTVNQTDTHGSSDVVAYYDIGGKNAALNIAVKKTAENEETPLRVTAQERGQPLDLTAMYNNYYMTAAASAPESVQFDPAGSVGIEGDAKKFSMALTGNDGYHALPWYTLKVSGDSATDPKITSGDDGYLLTGENMKGVTVFASNDTEASELTFKTDSGEVLIATDGTNLTASVDTDDDGRFETLLATGHAADPNSPPGGGGDWWKILLGALAGGLAVAAGAVFVFLKLKPGGGSKGKKKEKDNDEFKW
jgi:hypothetical protein